MSSEVMSVTKTPFADLPVNNAEQQAQTGDVEAPPVRVADMYSSRTSTSYGTRASEQTVQNAKIIVGSEHFLYELELHEFELVVELDKERKRNSEVDDGKHLSANVVKGNADPSRSGTSFLDEAEKGIVIDDGEDKEEADGDITEQGGSPLISEGPLRFSLQEGGAPSDMETDDAGNDPTDQVEDAAIGGAELPTEDAREAHKVVVGVCSGNT